ncbi:MAG: hypothetical protein JWN34_2676 [Bryobacterales bacterium]|nr:hypothetical protein [Bryobacterales bacterium]
MEPFTLTTFIAKFTPHMKNPDFQELITALEADLAPVGALEVMAAAEILHAKWRLRRYMSIDESQLTETAQFDLEKCRVRVANMVRREIAEFRRKQTERQIREQLGTGLTGLASSRELIATARAVRTAAVKDADPAKVDVVESEIHSKLQTETEKETESEPATQNLKIRTHFAGGSSSLSPQQARAGKNSGQRTHFARSTAQNPGRNAPCPCNSGQKYKRCCGLNPPTALKTAA